jgi:hypothetical protein
MPTPTKYTYSISNDTANGAVNPTTLTTEIQQSTIVVALDGIETGDDVLDIWFKDPLSGADQTTLTAVVAAHAGEPAVVVAGPAQVEHPAVTSVDGYASTTDTSFTPLRGTAYTEQTSNAQRSLVSSDANDAAAGTGARKVRVTYYPATLASGPLTEDVILDGTTPVDMAATNVCFIERLDVIEVGSQGGNVGTISLKAATAGGGVTVGTIAAGDNETNWCHHYVPTGKTMRVVSVTGAIRGLYSGTLHLRSFNPTSAVAAEKTIVPQVRVPAGDHRHQNFQSPIEVSGPARVLLYAKCEVASVTLDWTAGFGFYEE